MPMMIGVEDFLWLGSAAAVQMIQHNWHSLLLLIVSFVCLTVDPRHFSSIISKSKRRPGQTTEMGLQMSIVMIPALLQVVAHHYSETSSRWTNYSKIATLLVIPNFSITLVSFGIALLLDTEFDLFIASFFMVMWFIVLPMFPAKSTKSFTAGELRVVSLIAIMVVAEYARSMHEKNIEPDKQTITSLYTLVSLSGSISCCGFSYLGNNTQILPWWLKLGVMVAGPILVVDLSLFMITSLISPGGYYLPLSIQWLIEFLAEKENGFPRFWGLLYWVGILAIGSYPTFALLWLPSRNKPSVVVTRKWFHLIAVLLFGPITWQFPQLMSLSYAIAACILIVLETLRRGAPLLQSFYNAFIDDKKDDGDHIIVSHIFLIIGCAAPLWVSEVLTNRISSSSSSSLLVSEFGVLCIGIGDAMGAVIGKSMGKRRWGKNQRTLEGSLAMWLSMTVVGLFLCSSFKDIVALLVATTFTTILEAFTVQLDNLVLPIIGTSIVLLILGTSM